MAKEMAAAKAGAVAKEEFGFKDKLAYGAGDFGCNMSFALKGTLTLFWTQFMGIDNLVMASLLLLVQVWDAINDPLIGGIIDADRHHYKRNKFLAYIWFGGVGLSFAGALCYVPWTGAPAMVKNILFICGYIIWDAFYTIANVPYGSMLSLISADPVHRAQLSSFRSAGSMAGNILTGTLLPVLIYDASNNLRGERIWAIALVMGIIGLICFRFMVQNTTVRVNTEIELKEDAPKFNVLRAVGHFMRNRAALGATLAPVGSFLGMYGAGIASQIMFQAYFKNAQISGLISQIAYVGTFIYMPFVAKIVGRFGKKEAMTFGMSISCLAYVLMLVLPITPDNNGLMMFVGCQILNALGSGIGSCLSWSLMADAMDYEEWKFGTRNEGTTYAIHSFFRKLAQGIGPSVGLVVANALGYQASLGANQTAQVALNMRYQVAGMYLFSAVVQLVAYAVVYNLDKKTVAKMEAELKARKQAK